jgi:tetratricopeptide (TPR) repeat protein
MTTLTTLWIAWAISSFCPVADQGIADVRLMYQRGEFARVVDVGSGLLAGDPDNAELHHLVGRAMIDAGYNLRTEQAIDHLQHSMRGLPPDHWMLGWSHVYIGMAHDMAGRKQQARGAYELAIALDVTPECTAVARRRLALLAEGTIDPLVAAMQQDYAAKNYAAVVQAGRKALAAVPSGPGSGPATDNLPIKDPLFYHLLGRALIDQGERSDVPQAREHLQTSLSLADKREWISGWSHFYLGRAGELDGDLEGARQAYQRAVALAATPECVSSARFRLRHLGSDPYAGWLTHEMAYVTLRYPPDSPLAANPAAYGRRFDAAHQAIARALGVSPQTKIQVYLYTDAAQGRDITGQEVGWSDRENQVVHQHLKQTTGHEIAHCLSHFMTPAPYCDSVVLNEGLAVYFDQAGDDKNEAARRLLETGRLPDFSELETTFRSRDDAYALAGSFVGFLWHNYSRDIFRAAWRDAAGGQYETAFQRHYHRSSAQLSEEWKQYLGERGK